MASAPIHPGAAPVLDKGRVGEERTAPRRCAATPGSRPSHRGAGRSTVPGQKSNTWKEEVAGPRWRLEQRQGEHGAEPQPQSPWVGQLRRARRLAGRPAGRRWRGRARAAWSGDAVAARARGAARCPRRNRCARRRPGRRSVRPAQNERRPGHRRAPATQAGTGRRVARGHAAARRRAPASVTDERPRGVYARAPEMPPMPGSARPRLSAGPASRAPGPLGFSSNLGGTVALAGHRRLAGRRFGTPRGSLRSGVAGRTPARQHRPRRRDRRSGCPVPRRRPVLLLLLLVQTGACCCCSFSSRNAF